MTELNELCNMHILRYLYKQLPPDASMVFEARYSTDEAWKDQVDYVRYIMEDLNLPPDIPLDLALTLLNYEIMIREENIQITLNNFVKSERESYELEQEIDVLLNTIESIVEPSSLMTPASIATSDETPKTLKFSERSVSLPTHFKITNLLIKNLSALDEKLNKIKTFWYSKRTGKRKTGSRFSSSNQPGQYSTNTQPTLVREKM